MSTLMGKGPPGSSAAAQRFLRTKSYSETACIQKLVFRLLRRIQKLFRCIQKLLPCIQKLVVIRND